MRGRTWFVISLLSLAASSANGQESLEIFDGMWVSVFPPGPQIIFNKVGGDLRQAGLPVLGLATLSVSDGRDNSNLKVSGDGFDCFYFFTQIGPSEMVWDLKSGSASCPASHYFKKAQLQPSVGTVPKKDPAVSPANPIVREPTNAPEKDCARAQGDYVVVGVNWGDPDGGLNLRNAPGGDQVQGVIPSSGIGIGVGGCNSSWCQIRYGCQSGWANSRFLLPRSNVLRRVTGVNANDPRGLNVHTGPHHTFPVSASIAYNGVDVIEHTCQRSPNDGSSWCLITYQNYSGWVSARYLVR